MSRPFAVNPRRRRRWRWRWRCDATNY